MRPGVSSNRLKQQPNNSRNSSRGGGGLKKAPLAAWEAATRRAQLGCRWSRPEAAWGGVERVFGGVAPVHAVFHEQSWEIDVILVSICVRMRVM